jgi:hypothetical protein
MTDYQTVFEGDVEIDGNLKVNLINANGTISGTSVNSSGNMTAVGTVSGATVSSTGNITAVGSMSSESVTTNTINAGSATTTTITKPQVPTDLSVTTPSSLLVANSSGILGLLGVGTNGQLLGSDGTGLLWQTASGGGGGSVDIGGYIILSETYTNGSYPFYFNGTGSTIGRNVSANTSTGYQRLFNSNVNNLSGVSTSSTIIVNKTEGYFYNFTLPAGNYIVIGSFPAVSNDNSARHYANLEPTSGTAFVYGTVEISKNSSSTRSIINGVLALSASTTFTIKHYTSDSRMDLGVTTFNLNNKVGTIMFIKI